MSSYVDTTFTRVMDRGGTTFTDARFERCTFDNCAVSLTNDPTTMSRVSEVSLHDCGTVNSTVGPCVLDDVVVDGLKTPNPLIVWGAWFRHVTLRGRMGRIKVNRSIHDPRKTADMQAAFDAERERFYAGVDWALDISAAEFTEFSVEGVPCRLIRRDPATQVVVERSRIESVDQFAEVGALDATTEFVLRMFLTRSAEPELLLVATKGTRAAVERVRHLGLTLPD